MKLLATLLIVSLCVQSSVPLAAGANRATTDIKVDLQLLSEMDKKLDKSLELLLTMKGQARALQKSLSVAKSARTGASVIPLTVASGGILFLALTMAGKKYPAAINVRNRLGNKQRELLASFGEVIFYLSHNRAYNHWDVYKYNDHLAAGIGFTVVTTVAGGLAVPISTEIINNTEQELSELTPQIDNQIVKIKGQIKKIKELQGVLPAALEQSIKSSSDDAEIQKLERSIQRGRISTAAFQAQLREFQEQLKNAQEWKKNSVILVTSVSAAIVVGTLILSKAKRLDPTHVPQAAMLESSNVGIRWMGGLAMMFDQSLELAKLAFSPKHRLRGPEIDDVIGATYETVSGALPLIAIGGGSAAIFVTNNEIKNLRSILEEGNDRLQYQITQLNLQLERLNHIKAKSKAK